MFEVAENTLYKRLQKDIALQPIPTKVTVPLKTALTVLFDFDRADLRPESRPELERAVRFIQHLGPTAVPRALMRLANRVRLVLVPATRPLPPPAPAAA